MEAVYKRCSALTEVNTSFCPGCSHGLAFKVIAEIAEELEIKENSSGQRPSAVRLSLWISLLQYVRFSSRTCSGNRYRF